jgi:phosphate starvation-inducible protein PhoH and related proteins
MTTIRLDSKAIEALAGHLDETLRLIEERFDVSVSARGSDVTVTGQGEDAASGERRVADLVRQLAALHDQGVALGREDYKTAIGIMARSADAKLSDHFLDARLKPSARKTVVAKSENQRLYIEAIRANDLVFGIGPAGTGKTYLAVAMAITLLNERRIQRILLCRPAVEAGEKLGFLPGDLAAKVDPYLRPLYDALYDMLEPDRIERLLERGTIEVAPLAFMRGRTLNDSFIILDEAQNTTTEQMKMFLTRIGLDSKAVVTGDVTQIDLPAQKVSGLVEAEAVVAGIPGIAVVRFAKTDVVRHPLVQRIIHAYDQLAERREKEKEGRANGRATHAAGSTAGESA